MDKQDAAVLESRQTRRYASTHRDFFELITELDDWGSSKLSRLVHGQNTMFEIVQFRFDEQQIATRQRSAIDIRDGTGYKGYLRARLDGQETGSRDVEPDGTVKVFNGRSDSRLELNDSLTTIRHLVVDDDFEIQGVLIHDPLDSLHVTPCAVISTRRDFSTE